MQRNVIFLVWFVGLNLLGGLHPIKADQAIKVDRAGAIPAPGQAPLGELPHTFSTSYERLGRSQVPFVRVVLDDGQPHLFALDPGTANTSIDSTAAKTLNLPITAQELAPGVKVDTTTSSASLGSSHLKLNHIPFIVTDLSDLRAAFPSLIGILGANLLSQFIERIDFSKQRIDFIIPDSSENRPLNPATSPPILLTQGKGQNTVSVFLDGHPAMFALSTLYDYTTVHSHSLLAILKPKASLSGLPSGEGTPIRFLRLSSLRLGNVQWGNPVVEEPLAKEMPDTNILGMDFLRRFQLTIDLGGSRIYLDPEPSYREDPAQWNGLGLFPVKTPQGKLVIAAIGDPSPAKQAGLQVGDGLTQIDGLATDSMTLEQAAARVKKPVGAILVLKVRRKGENGQRIVRLKVEKLL